ncbi:hypothetical protein [Ruegeria aquimaris]|uniref:Citrate transporter n=1 Tax=Ruegeria aquimaris TaxID=2984333 RepID=A0ABT3AGH0_9RHOB|nr:hypothetical protein [Ruegeria sp. XHP0148]MCV2887779.1 hypothetical protein [Ruegeria sp. XHP0148]
MMISRILDSAAAVLLVLLTLGFGFREWGVDVPPLLIQGVALAILLLLGSRVRATRKAFIVTGIALSVWLAAAGQDWLRLSLDGLDKAAFIAAFFTALSTLRNVAETSPALQRTGRFLASQPPGRRYAALTVGGHLFALLINYGSISLLGGLAAQSARSEADPLIRSLRTRRMLLAIQRGFISSLPWSPLAFAMAITTAVVPGASWATSVVPGLGSAAIILLTGWAMDIIFKPRLANPPKRAPVEGSWALLAPLFVLLALLAVTVLGFHAWLDVRVVGVVMLAVPTIAIAWAGLQHRSAGPETSLRLRARRFLGKELPAYRGEIVLLMMAGYIGTVGAPLLQPMVRAAGFDMGVLPPWLVLAMLVWMIPLLGQIGMNPILAVTLIAPLIPAPETLGVAPSALVIAIASGWALSGATSPFTATTLLIGAFANVSALHVGLKWNGGYFLVTACLLTVWVLVYGFVL